MQGDACKLFASNYAEESMRDFCGHGTGPETSIEKNTIWTGIGAVGAFVLGIVLLGEAVTPMRLFAAGLIVSGIVLMKLSSPA